MAILGIRQEQTQSNQSEPPKRDIPPLVTELMALPTGEVYSVPSIAD